jgi:hypothetical protein
MSSSKEQWNKAHASTKNNSTIPSRLYTDENPATTIKGTGFKNERIAKRTIELTSQPGVRYKQYWTIRAMRERAAHHPNKSAGIRDAITVFDEWLENYTEPTDQEKQLYKQEWAEFRRLCATDSNKHSYGKDPTKEELKRSRDDLVNGQKSLIQLLSNQRQASSMNTPFPLTSFVALFGGPGMHGYGSHEINDDQSISRVNIDGDEGIQELIGAAKTSKLMLGNVSKVEVKYNRTDELGMATIIKSKQSKTLKNLWGRSAETSPCGKKTQIIGSRPKEDEDTLPEWACNTCTFVHVGCSKRDFLACELCGSTRLTDDSPQRKKSKHETTP